MCDNSTLARDAVGPSTPTTAADINSRLSRHAIDNARPCGATESPIADGGWYNVYVCLFALKSDVDVIVGGRACDTAIFASLPALLEFPVGLAMHLAKIIECASLCCVSFGSRLQIGSIQSEGRRMRLYSFDRDLFLETDPSTVHPVSLHAESSSCRKQWHRADTSQGRDQLLR